LAIPLISNITIINASDDDLPYNLKEFYHLEYFLQFSPHKNGYSTTKYAVDLETFNNSGESFIRASLFYEDLQLTLFNDNYGYIISLSSREILEANNNNYNQFISGTHTELFLNESEYENSHKIRIDETLTFSNYFIKYQEPNSFRSDVTFNYVGIENYSSNLLYDFTTYHYNITHVIWSDGDY